MGVPAARGSALLGSGLRLRRGDPPLLAGIGALTCLGVWTLRTFDPNAPGSPLPGCIFHQLTGYWCVGCGMTRALHALVHGDPVTAFAMNPVGMLALPAVGLLLASSRGWIPPRWLRPITRWVSEPKLWLIVLPTYWVLRNLPWFPFTLLAPPGSS